MKRVQIGPHGGDVHVVSDAGGPVLLTIRELAAIPLLAPLGKRHLADLLRLAADIRLGPGEYVVNEGDEPAFFLVLEGEIEVVKLIDGEERTIGKRGVGQLHGEVPLAYGGAFQAGGRAAIASRVLKVSARQYHLIADEVPGFADAVNDLARERLSGLKGIASAPHPAQVTIVGHRWDTTCVALRRFLSSNQIVFDSLILEAPEFEGHWTGAMPADRDLPLVKLVDGTVLARPNHRQLAERLHLQTVPHHAEYDSVIVGGGPAGLAAAVYGASEGLRTIVIERETPGGQAGTSSRIENYLGFPSGISGDELADRALRQARRLGAEILVTRSIEGIDPETRNITLDGGDVLHARTIILATGVSWRHLALDGFDRLIGRGIYYGASRTEADVTQGLDIHLIGAGNSAGQAAMFFANHARTVALIVRGDSLEKSMSQYLV
ncbi:MAG: FAD-dependent oxidoreductase, partial [Bauldia sp.]|nr:FAD-dependent oxidoreductase [Bauldia sp.]